MLLALMVMLPGAPDAHAADPIVPPDAPRLLDQPLTSEASRNDIKAILQHAPFKNNETVTRYRFGEDKRDAKTTDDGSVPEWLKTLLRWLDSQRFNALAALLEVLLWGLLLAGISLLIWRYRDANDDEPAPGKKAQRGSAHAPATVRAGCPARQFAGGHCWQRRTPVAVRPSRRARSAVSRAAQPTAA
jgi:hypothetical protein